MNREAVLISIRPEFAQKILSGEKTVEFRRRWTTNQVKVLVIYATAPLQRIVAIAEIGRVVSGGLDELLALCEARGGGLSEDRLRKYFQGITIGFGLELCGVRPINGINPRIVFGAGFRPPQSFRYLLQSERESIEASGLLQW